MKSLRSANVQTIVPSVRSAFVALGREAGASLRNAAMSSNIAGGSSESMTLDYPSNAFDVLAGAYKAVYGE